MGFLLKSNLLFEGRVFEKSFMGVIIIPLNAQNNPIVWLKETPNSKPLTRTGTYHFLSFSYFSGT